MHLQTAADAEELQRELLFLRRESFICRKLDHLAARGAEPDEMLEFVWRCLRSDLPFDRLAIATVDCEEGLVVTRWHHTAGTDTGLPAGTIRTLRGSTLEPLITEPEPFVIPDLEEWLEKHHDSWVVDSLVREGMRASLTLPLLGHGEVIGFLFLSSSRTYPWTREHIDLAGRVAVRLSIVLHELLEDRARYFRTFGIGVHELRNPLCAISGYASMLLQGLRGPLPPGQAEVLQRILRICGRASRTLTDLLDVTAFETGRLQLRIQDTNLAGLTGDIVEDHEAEASEKKIGLQTWGTEDELIARVDPTRVGQALSNLISNSLKYSAPDTCVRIGVAARDGHAEIRVQDCGMGIPSEELPHIFRSYRKGRGRTTAGESSHGIGLLVVKTVVEAHGGQIHVETREGEGTVFRLFFPRGGPPDCS